MDFSNVKAITIPEGQVKKITIGGVDVWSASRLPDAYQEVEWIRSQGATQYIDLQYTERLGVSLEIDFIPHNTAGQFVYGHRKTGAGQGLFFLNVDSSSRLQWSILATDSSVYVPLVGTVSFTERNNVHLDFLSGNQKAYINGIETFSGSATSFYIDNAINSILFGYHVNNVYNKQDVTVYKFKLWEDGVLIRDMVPCYQKSNNAIGMYDLARNQFCPNNGSGVFAKGGDV